MNGFGVVVGVGIGFVGGVLVLGLWVVVVVFRCRVGDFLMGSSSSVTSRETVRSLSSKGVHAIAIDLPGSGFSDKSTVEFGKGRDGVLGRFLDVYSVIQEKGLFWAFDEIIGPGEMPYVEIEKWVSTRKSVRVLELGPEEIGRVLGQVIDSMRLSPVNLVLHDSALGMCANWVLENLESVRSVTLLDTASRSVPALPLWILEMPLIREVVLGFSGAYMDG